MSTSTTPSDHERTAWEELSHHRQRLLKTIVAVNGRGDLERPDFRDDVKSSSTVEEVIDKKAKVLKSIKDTGLLNGLVRDGYLTQTYQGGENPIVLYLEYEEERDDYEVAAFGNLGRLHDLVFQILDHHGLSEGALDEVDMTDFNALVNAVNRVVGRTVLVIVSEASEYEWANDEAYEIAAEKAKEARRDD